MSIVFLNHLKPIIPNMIEYNYIYCIVCLPCAGQDLSVAALEACLAVSNSNVQQAQGQCKGLQAQLATLEAAHASDMEAVTQQLADAAGSLAAKEAVIR